MAKCFLCDGTGQYKEPRNRKEFEELLDKYDHVGTLDPITCRKRALDKVGYDIIECPHCKGTGEE